MALIGDNNSGKSNLLRAIDVLVSAGAGRLTKDDFKDPETPIIIKGTFDSLTESERKRWKSYLVEGHLILEKRVSLVVDDRSGKEKVSAEFHGYRAEPSAWYLSLRKIIDKYGDRPKWADIVKEASLPDYFLQDGKCTKGDFTKGLERYLAENDVEYDPPDSSTTQALGLQSNVVASGSFAMLIGIPPGTRDALANWTTEASARTSEYLPTLAGAITACSSFAAPDKRRWIPIPAADSRLQPFNNLTWLSRMLAVQSSALNDTLDRFGHVEP